MKGTQKFKSFLPSDIADGFVGSAVLKQALRVAKNGKKAGYERLEFLGDRVVGLVVAQMLYQHFPDAPEGEMARRFVSLVRAETLAKVALQLGLDALIDTNEEELRKNVSVLSDVCEAVMAALYLTYGLEVVRAVMRPLWTELMEKDIIAPKDSKSALQEYAQQHHFDLPKYTVIGQSGSAHHPTFTVEVCVGKYQMQADGENKKTAEQKAAEGLLAQLKGKK